MPEPLPLSSLVRAAVITVRSLLPDLPILPDDLEVVIRSRNRGAELFRVIVPREACGPPPAQPPPPGSPAAPPGPARGPVLNDMERDILQAVGECPDTVLTGEDIAQRAGYECDSVFRGCLAGLRRRGLLGGEPGSRGYRAVTQAPPAS